MAVRVFLIALLALTGCATQAPQSKDAVRQAILDHLGKRTDMLATSMNIEVVSVNFRQNEADAIVSVSPKEGGEGMQMTYNLAAEGSKWVVKKSASGGQNPHEGAPTTPSGALPPGHPPVGDSTRAPK